MIPPVYFCYVDETGNDDRSPVLIMVGVLVDSTRLSRTQEEFDKIFATLTALTGRTLSELKSSDVLPGKNAWKGVDGETRRNVIENLCGWVRDRNHKLVVAAIDRARHAESEPGCSELEDEWQAAAAHVVLQVQRLQQAKDKKKGRTVVVVDDNKRGLALLSDFVYSPPIWTDDYYGRTAKQGALDMIVDTPFAVRSHHVGLVQVADLLAGVLRRYVELADHGWPEHYEGEREHYEAWVAALQPSMIGKEHRWAKNNKSPCSQWYRDLAPPSLVAALG
jgi:hypothetical protein